MAEAHLAEPCRGARRPLHNVGFDPKPPLISVEGSDGLCPEADLWPGPKIDRCKRVSSHSTEGRVPSIRGAGQLP